MHIPGAVFSVIAIATPLEATLSAAVSQEAAQVADQDVVVTTTQLRATKIDYRLRKSSVSYCGPRDNLQDGRAVFEICEFVRDCAFDGAKTVRSISDCVEERMASTEAKLSRK